MGSSFSCELKSSLRRKKFRLRRLACAIREGDLQSVSALLDLHPSFLNAPLSSDRLSPLHCAAALGQPEVLSLLLQRDAHINILNSDKQTPLMLACKNGRLECIERLLDKGADVLMFDSLQGRTCLHYAAKSGHLACTQKILNFSQGPSVADSWGFARFVNVRDGAGATPLHLAARNSHSAVVRLLLSSGALVCATTTRSSPDSGSGYESTPLHFAARGGSTECVKELLAWGADRNHRNSKERTPYSVAIKYKNDACAALLNPDTPEPLVWPSSWRFIRNLDPEAKTLLEAALKVANDARETTIEDSCNVDETNSASEEKEEKEGFDMCSICYEEACTITVENCGHQMCAGCTLALCCHSKPKPGVPNSPPPACPFCRCNILQLRPSRPKETVAAILLVADAERDGVSAGKTRKSGEGCSNSFMGLVVGRGSFKLLPGRSSGKVADTDSMKESTSEGV